MTNVVIASAARTPVGSFLGSFANTPAHELGATVLAEVVKRAGIDASEVSETILGQVLTAAQGQNPARQASMAAGIPKEVPAWGVNQVCGSGLRAVALAAQAVATGDATITVLSMGTDFALDVIKKPLAMGADDLATAVLVLGPQDGLHLLNQLEGVEGMIVTKEQDVLRSRGLSHYTA